jgi:hypothetical protein
MTYHSLKAAPGPGAWLKIIALPVVLAGCGAERDGDALQDAPPRPDTREGIIEIEGTQERFVFDLFEAPRGFPVRFSTYVPRDMVAEAEAEDETGTVRFVANFGGRRNDLAVLHFYFFPEGVLEEQARAELQTFATSRGVPRSLEIPDAVSAPPPQLQTDRVTAEQLYDWARYGFRFSMEGPDGVLLGTASLGWYRDRFFHVVMQYPEEYAEGFVPRAEWIIRDWRWDDTGEPLGGPGATPGMPPAPDPAPEDV